MEEQKEKRKEGKREIEKEIMNTFFCALL